MKTARWPTQQFRLAILLLLTACNNQAKISVSPDALKPVVTTDTVVFDTDDPAIWINPSDKAGSLIIGTDKENGGGLYAFDLHGKIVAKAIGLKRPNNVDIVYGIVLGGKQYDLAVTTERETNMLRFFSLPDLKEMDGGGLEVFQGETQRLPMGVAVYKSPATNTIDVIVGRKSGPADGYLWQYRLIEENGKLAMRLLRKFGKYSGKKEIESIAVDNELGYIYYSDEQVGIRKYFADPAKGNEELALFGKGEFLEDNEGISIYKTSANKGYILVSNQAASSFNIYPREGSVNNANEHKRITSIPVSTIQSDGSEVCAESLPGYPGGIFVAMSDNKTFQYYRWADIARKAGLETKQ